MVNTFLLSNDFDVSAKQLDTRRLFKQCVEAKQIINILEELDSGKVVEKKGFSNHPATKQWIGYTIALKKYFNAHLEEVFRRKSHKTTMSLYVIPCDKVNYPWFVECKQFVFSHMASLQRKDPEYYANLSFPSEYKNYGYIWPSHLTAPDREIKINIDNLDQYKLNEICDPIQETMIDVKRCGALIKSGPRKGKPCGNIVKNKNNNYCGVHQK